MQMGLNPMQSNGSLTYDSFWSAHTAAAGSWRKLVGQGSSGNLGGLSDNTGGGIGMENGAGGTTGMGGSTMAGDGMSAQSTGVPMSATAGLHG